MRATSRAVATTVLLAILAATGSTAIAAPTPGSAQATAEKSGESSIRYSKLARPTVTKTSTKRVSPAGYTFTGKTITLKGSTKKTRATFKKYANAVIAKEIKAVDKICKGDDSYIKSKGGTFSSTGTVYKNRYVSFVVSVQGNCGATGPQSFAGFTLDTKTGKMVSLSKFVNKKILNSNALYAPVNPGGDGCTGILGLDFSPGYNHDQTPTQLAGAWSVSSKGVTLYFPRGSISQTACGTLKTTVSWKVLPKPETSKQATKYYTYSTKIGGMKYVEIVKTKGDSMYLFGGPESSDDIWFVVGKRTSANVFYHYDLAGTGKIMKVKIGGTYSKPNFSKVYMLNGKKWTKSSAADRKNLIYVLKLNRAPDSWFWTLGPA